MSEQDIKNLTDGDLIDIYKETVKQIAKLESDLKKAKEGAKNA